MPEIIDPIQRYQENIKLSTYIANRFKNENNKAFHEDIEGEARLALWRACLKYDSSAETKFSTFAGIVIARRLIVFRRQFLSKSSHDISLQTPTGEDITLEDSVEDFKQELIGLSIENIIKLLKATRYLKYSALGYSQKEICKEFGICRTSVWERVKEERAELKKVLGVGA
jgi:RNA polymerase sporulation-specific sigma factor